MIREIEIEGFKSIDRLRLRPARVTVMIGENGCGKSNILEAIAMGAAAASDLLDHQFLGPRGIRVTRSPLMVPRFPERESERTCVSVTLDDETPFVFELAPQHSERVSNWLRSNAPKVRRVTQSKAEWDGWSDEEKRRFFQATQPLAKLALEKSYTRDTFQPFLVYAPENSVLRTFQSESAFVPLGYRGEGLFAHLEQLRDNHPDALAAIDERLRLIDWFDGFDVPTELAPYERRLDIRDRYLDPLARFDQRSANEGFLFLLFYYTLIISPETPPFFAIDNVDASLNPRLCARLMRDITQLAPEYGKQVILTTHNPALLDGIDLTDDNQKLLVVSRSPDGPTRVRRIKPPRKIEGARQTRLSEAFIWGHLGGLPKNF